MSLQKADVSKFDPEGAGDPKSNIFGLNFTRQESNLILIPVPWEATTSYGRGAAKGPKCIRDASPQLDLFDAELGQMGLARPWEYGIFMETESAQIRRWNTEGSKFALPIVKAGGKIEGRPALKKALARVNLLSSKVNDFVYEHAKAVLKENKLVGVVGGDHSVPFGAIRAVAEAHGNVGVLHVDAHADLRKAYEGFEHSHASIMNNVVNGIEGVSKLVQVGIRDFCDSEYDMAKSHPKISTHFDFELQDALARNKSWNELCEKIVEELPQKVYISFDIDGLDPALCPHTGTPVPGGLSFAQAVHLLKTVALKKKTVVGFDLNEVAPGKNSEWDGNVGARLLYKLCGIALLTHL